MLVTFWRDSKLPPGKRSTTNDRAGCVLVTQSVIGLSEPVRWDVNGTDPLYRCRPRLRVRAASRRIEQVQRDAGKLVGGTPRYRAFHGKLLVLLHLPNCHEL